MPRFTINEVDEEQPAGASDEAASPSPVREQPRQRSSRHQRHERQQDRLGMPFEQHHQIRESASTILERQKAEALQRMRHEGQRRPKPKIYRAREDEDY